MAALPDAEASGFFSSLYEKGARAWSTCKQAVTARTSIDVDFGDIAGKRSDKGATEIASYPALAAKPDAPAANAVIATAATEVTAPAGIAAAQANLQTVADALRPAMAFDPSAAARSVAQAGVSSAAGAAKLILSSPWQALKGTSMLTALCYGTQPLCERGGDAVEAAAAVYFGSPWAAKITRVMLHPKIYEISRDAVAIAGWKAPDIAWQTVAGLAAAGKDPKKAMAGVWETLKTAAHFVSTQAGSYFLTEPAAEITGKIAYATILVSTASPVLAQGAYVGAKGFAHYTGLANGAAKVLGYNVPNAVAYGIEGIRKLANALYPAVPAENTADDNGNPDTGDAVTVQAGSDDAPGPDAPGAVVAEKAKTPAGDRDRLAAAAA